MFVFTFSDHFQRNKFLSFYRGFESPTCYVRKKIDVKIDVKVAARNIVTPHHTPPQPHFLVEGSKLLFVINLLRH